jgi:SAM-dependent methyltransferase
MESTQVNSVPAVWQQSEQPAEVVLDKEKAEAFAQKMLDVLNYAGLALMISIGHRTRLFDVMSRLPRSSSLEIAQAAELNERYVREWLGAMVTGGLVEYNQVDHTYGLPPEHSAFLTPAASPNNLAVSAQFISILGGVEDRIIECFRHGGGVPYSEYSRLHEVLAEESDQSVCAGLLEVIIPLVPALEKRLRKGARVLDVGCGSGRAVNRLAEAFPASRFTGYDTAAEAIVRAQNEAELKHLSNAHFLVRDAADLEKEEEYDLITAFDSIHDQARPARVLQRIARALKHDGVFLMQDIAGSSMVHKNLDLPLGPLGYTISCMHCLTVSLAQEGAGLGAMWGREKAFEMLMAAGFRQIEIRSLVHDILNSYFIVRK